MVAARHLLFVGKVMRRENEFIPKQLMTTWVNIRENVEDQSPPTRAPTSNAYNSCTHPMCTKLIYLVPKLPKMTSSWIDLYLWDTGLKMQWIRRNETT